MPPRLSALRAFSSLPSNPTPCRSFLAPLLQQQPQQIRAASILAGLSDAPGAYNKRIRRGRGPASGKGKTSGRGHKGQKQHGKVPVGFNGGQTSYEVTHPEKGFVNQFSAEMSPLNLDRLQQWIDQGRIDPSKPITLKELHKSRCLHGVKDGVKLLGKGSEQLRTPVNIVVSRASTTAIAAVEAAGGTVITRYYSPNGIKHVLRGLSDPIASIQMPTEIASASGSFKYRLPDATSRKDIEYYRDPAHRGYLSHLVSDGEGPSLFFKTPGSGKAAKKTSTKSKSQSKAENRIW
ncbi:50s ribosomal subunit protein l15 [Neofusicoccum parvum]|uniref:Putative 50s ribosomal subunit protein l15 protein n=1 Tax=Botryosphaeria parva (strain UCR-NP2) TaxID=1287680 RepID=R1EQ40_BOTPV|nr:putative 50s ribosomal subunit protein l15 protein [Neofusicoccum parvum UCRNP2]GME48152.1 50s ribosomal subunit protein l15 [Neofusicoccum parvum]